jgi:hypothetical protein
MKRAILATLITATGDSVRKSPIDLPFDTLLSQCQLDFKMPKDFKPTAVKKFENGFYQYAIKHESGFEIRYYIKPFSSFYGTDTLFERNKMTLRFFLSMNYDISGTALSGEFDEFPKAAVKYEFNADYGATSAFKPNDDFGKGFEMCSTVTLRKDDVGEVIIFYMISDRKQEPIMKRNFTIMKFKK